MFPDIATEVSVMRNNKNSSLIAATLTLALGAGAAWAANPANPGDAPTTTPSGRTPSGQVMPGGSEGAKTDATVVPQPVDKTMFPTFAQADLNKSGTIEPTEIGMVKGLDFQKADVDHNGTLSKTEYEQAVQSATAPAGKLKDSRG